MAAGRALDVRRVGGERGSAVVDFVLVGVLVVAVFLGVFQLGYALYARNTLISCASEGARFGARADSDPAQGVQRTRGAHRRVVVPAVCR